MRDNLSDWNIIWWLVDDNLFKIFPLYCSKWGRMAPDESDWILRPPDHLLKSKGHRRTNFKVEELVKRGLIYCIRQAWHRISLKSTEPQRSFSCRQSESLEDNNFGGLWGKIQGMSTTLDSLSVLWSIISSRSTARQAEQVAHRQFERSEIHSK